MSEFNSAELLSLKLSLKLEFVIIIIKFKNILN